MHDDSINYGEIAVIKRFKYSNTCNLIISRKNYEKSRYPDYFEKGDKGTVNNEKLSCNLSRAKKTVFELAMCNPWNWFGTFTINGNKHDRDDLKGFYKKFAQWIRDYNKKYNLKIKYLFVPERHEDGNWHMHGFLYGLPIDHLVPFKEGDKTESGKPIPRYLWENGYRNWLPYMKKFGWCSFGIIKSHERVSKYVMKYFTKDMEKSVQEVNAKSFYSSKGLEKATEVARGFVRGSLFNNECDFENDFVKITNFDKVVLPYVLDKIIPLKHNDDKEQKTSL